MVRVSGEAQPQGRIKTLREMYWAKTHNALVKPARLTGCGEPTQVGRAKDFAALLDASEPAIQSHELIVGVALASRGKDSTINVGEFNGHYTPGHATLQRLGLTGIRDRAREKLRTEADPKKRDYLDAVAMAYEAAIRYARRYADLARALAEEASDATRRAELAQIAAACEGLGEHAPQTFHEALQLFWFTFMFGATGSVGRFDQWMYPCFRADMDSGRLTREQAQELLECVWIKVNYFAGNNDSLRNVALAGQTRSGGDAANDLTFMCLQASATLMLPEPKLNVRFFQGSPRALLEDCCKLIKKGLSQPAIFNDEVVIPALLDIGTPLEDARDYCNDGCSEIIMGGRGTIGFRVTDLLPILNATVHAAPAEGFPAFETLLEDFKSRVEKVLPNGPGGLLAVTHAFLGPSMEDCLESASPTGVRYFMWGEIAAGVANTSDGLAAIRRLVYREKALSWAQLVAAMKADYRGEHEVVRQMLLNRAPKFGNDEDEVDLLAKDITEFFLDAVHAKGLNVPGTGPKRAAGLMSFGIHNRKNIPSSPDGRRPGEHCGNSFSPGLGRDRKGPTAVLKTVSKVSTRKASHGSVLDMAFHPTAVSGQEGFEKLVALVDTFLKLPCTATLQTNVVDRDMLLHARQNPKAEEYRTLIVRVWGFSAVFVELIPDLQDHVIARTEHRL